MTLVEEMTLDELYDLEAEHSPLVGNRTATFLDPSERSLRQGEQPQGVSLLEGPPAKRVSAPEVPRPALARAHWMPNTDVYATDDGLVVKVELAGMRSEHLEIFVEGNRLRVSGNRPDGCRAGKCSFLVMEINYGPFEKVLELPPGHDLSKAKAAYLNGFLRIDVPFAVQQEPTQQLGENTPLQAGGTNMRNVEARRLALFPRVQ